MCGSVAGHVVQGRTVKRRWYSLVNGPVAEQRSLRDPMAGVLV